jgi:hypothetical protein
MITNGTPLFPSVQFDERHWAAPADTTSANGWFDDTTDRGSIFGPHICDIKVRSSPLRSARTRRLISRGRNGPDCSATRAVGDKERIPDTSRVSTQTSSCWASPESGRVRFGEDARGVVPVRAVAKKGDNKRGGLYLQNANRVQVVGFCRERFNKRNYGLLIFPQDKLLERNRRLSSKVTAYSRSMRLEHP